MTQMTDTNAFFCISKARKLDDLMICSEQSGDFSAVYDYLSKETKSIPEPVELAFPVAKRSKTTVLLVIMILLLTAAYLLILGVFVVSYRLGASYSVLPKRLGYIAILIICANLTLFALNSSGKNLIEIYNMLVPYMNRNPVSFITDLAAVSGQREKDVVNVIRIALRTGMLPRGRLVCDNKVLLLSSSVIDYYKVNQETCDRYFQNISRIKDNYGERSDLSASYLAECKADIQRLEDEYQSSSDVTVQQSLASISERIPKFILIADSLDNGSEYCFYLLKYYLITSERLLRNYCCEDIVAPQKELIQISLSMLNRLYDNYLQNICMQNNI